MRPETMLGGRATGRQRCHRPPALSSATRVVTGHRRCHPERSEGSCLCRADPGSAQEYGPADWLGDLHAARGTLSEDICAVRLLL